MAYERSGMVIRYENAYPQQTTNSLLIVFGDINFTAQKVTGEKVYHYLTSRNVWFVSKCPRSAVSGMPILFYQSGVGFRGTATVANIGRTSASDGKDFSMIPLGSYPTKITLRNLHTFADPLDPRPLLQELSFVTNKKYWGHAFRNSPGLSR